MDELFLSPWEKDAELAYANLEEIAAATKWCLQQYPSKFAFLNSIAKLLRPHVGKDGNFKSELLSILSPGQAIKLLGIYMRSTSTNPVIRNSRLTVQEILAVRSDEKRDEIIKDIRKVYLGQL